MLREENDPGKLSSLTNPRIHVRMHMSKKGMNHKEENILEMEIQLFSQTFQTDYTICQAKHTSQ